MCLLLRGAGEDAAGRSAPQWIIGEKVCTAIAKGKECLEKAGRWLLDDALEGGELTDMEFVLDSGRRVRAHRVWLMGRCEYVRRMLLSGMQEERTGVIPVRDCSDGAFMALLECLYTGSMGALACVGQDFVELWRMGDMFGMSGMLDLLLKGVGLEDAAEVASVGLSLGILELVERCDRVVPLKVSSIKEAHYVAEIVDVLLQGHVEASRGIDYIERFVDWDDDQWSGQPGYAGALVRCMTAGVGSALVQQAGCHGISRLVQNDAENSQIFGEEGGIEAVVAAMRAHRDDDDVQANGCDALSFLVEDDDDNRRRAGEKGVIGAVLAMMRARGKDATAQNNGCHVLRLLTQPQDDASNKNRRLSVEEGAIEAVLVMMREHVSRSDLQSHGFLLLWNLVRGDESNLRQAVDRGGIATVQNALQKHQDDVDMQFYGEPLISELIAADKQHSSS